MTGPWPGAEVRVIPGDIRREFAFGEESMSLIIAAGVSGTVSLHESSCICEYWAPTQPEAYLLCCDEVNALRW